MIIIHSFSKDYIEFDLLSTYFSITHYLLIENLKIAKIKSWNHKTEILTS
ncbi:hypothetical protein MPTP_0633 [Melissococcus plutonius ATCC 35311]|uniref:Uncharacterized protein n=2 Tax=Melissococcus plutonius TaxID=33970 RepID=F3Y9C3_MELPT|nr:hypothetical protein [Melissococcus plutonius]BAL62507.1 hypothetical protein MPD5_1291 [Melissococcus plutonius DAT561]BAK21101.1 hypothetical protein MPTP_0633 [Melissococcus plutonius ATCC 35311]BBC61390.1 hypothetical protein DAT561_1285 [Melissococcus plutonius]BBD14931.1 hypothetical protein DAT585_0568 [Melissococcus plutonius]BBD16371.1 hypothetical protein DAT606_0324 [Melissococcus plutonius]